MIFNELAKKSLERLIARGNTTYRRYECELCDWKGMITGNRSRIWKDVLPKAIEELEKHFEEEHGITSWPEFRVRVVVGYVNDLDLTIRGEK